MPWNGLLTPEGTERIVCDPNVDRPSPSAVTPAMFSGETIYKSRTTSGMPSFTIGLSDYTLEWFVKGRTVGSDPGDSTEIRSGLVAPGLGLPEIGELQDGLQVSDASDPQLRLSIVTSVASDKPVDLIAGEWLQVGVAVNRDGFARFFRNGTTLTQENVIGTKDLDILTAPIHPMMGNSGDRSVYDRLDDNDDLVDSPKCYISSFAIHNREISLTEIADNFSAKVVGLYPETVVRYLFREFVDNEGIRVPVVKETDKANISLGCKDRIAEPQNSELYVPKAAPGTLFIEDSSGNGRHWPLATQTSYGSGALADRGICGFATTGAS